MIEKTEEARIDKSMLPEALQNIDVEKIKIANVDIPENCCWRCEYFYLHDKKKDGKYEGGECRFNPPKSDIRKPYKRFYPYVKIGDSCSKYTKVIEKRSK